MSKKRIIDGISAIVLMVLLILPLPLLAQDATPTPASPDAAIPLIHTVSEGENLTFIADSYGITVAELIAVNNLSDGDNLFLGQELVIPGGEGDAIATLYTVQAGDTLTGVATDFATDPTAVAAANRLINPYQPLQIGQNLTVVSRTGSALPSPPDGTAYVVAPGDTLLTIAARFNLPPTNLMRLNDLSYPVRLLPGQRLRLPGDGRYRQLPGGWTDVQVGPLPFIAGNTLSVYVESVLDGTPSGELGGQRLRFAPEGSGFAAIVGLDAFTEPGTYLLELGGEGERPWPPFTQQIVVNDGGYGVQNIVVSDDLAPLLAPEIRANEDDFLALLYTNSAPDPLWDDVFLEPVTNTIVTARYGDGRSYNGGPIDIFHSGVDFGGTVGTPIVSPANGVVVFNDVLELRGLTMVVDHGFGVVTAYFHLSETFAEVGDAVSAGQQIAAGGDSGLSTGPHLHWEFRVNGVAVNGLQWTQVAFP